MRITINKRALPLSIIIMIMIVQIPLMKTFKILQYLDEGWTVVSIVYLLVIIVMERKMEREMFVSFWIIMLLLGIGLLGNIIWQIQTGTGAILTDIGNMFKTYMTLYAGVTYLNHWEEEDKLALLQYVNGFCCIIVTPGFFLAITNLFVNINMHTEYVNGFRAFHYVFNRVGNLNMSCVIMLMIETAWMNYLDAQERKTQRVFLFMTLMLMLSTLRSRAYGFFIIYVLGYLIFVYGRSAALKAAALIAIPGISLGFGVQKFVYYFGYDTSARGVLFQYGVRTANSYFPIGSGFATYGTYAARKYYSPLYFKYGFEKVWGLSQKMGDFLTDDYWPAVMGEFGYFGAFLMLILITLMFFKVLGETGDYPANRFAGLFGLICMVISSMVSASFFHTMSVVLSLTVAVCIVCRKNMKDMVTFDSRL
uniref:hypothetical protein n=1 Tax=Eubacterium cellulosolvens TaxID=29322 RepID=UPI000A702285|nr:hypothetical protein [[Eubacterium] cellulosolvens]